MSRLIIVDQSLKGLGGHHFDYTLQVAKAAASRQCEVVVATNRKFRGCSRLDHYARLFPAFRNTSYSRYSLLAGLRAMFGRGPLELGRESERTPVSISENLSDSQRKFFSGLFRRQNAYLQQLQRRFYRQWNYVKESSGRNRVVKTFAADCQAFFRTVGLTENDHVFFPTISDLDLAGLLTYWMTNPESHQPVWHMQFHFDVFTGRVPDYRRQMANVAPLRDLFEDIEHAVPSYQLHYYATTDAIADQYQRLCSRQVSELSYPISDGFLKPASRSSSVLSVHRVQPELEDRSQEAVRLSFDVSHLPLEPIGQHPEPTVVQGGNFGHMEEELAPMLDGRYSGIPIVVAGGIREEKGQACLTDLLPEMNRSLFQPGLGFLVCQRKPQKRWWKSRAFQFGDRLPTCGNDEACDASICYLPHPLEPRLYQQMIRNTGIGLLAYDRESYANRRAGIFGEYLAAGVPVLVPAGTWMADQLESANLIQRQRILEQAHCFADWNFHQLDWADWNVPSAGGTVTFDGQDVPAYAWSPEFDSVDEGHWVSVGFDWQWPKERGSYCRVQVLFHSAQKDVLGSASCVIGRTAERHEGLVVFHVPAGTASLRVGLSNAYHERNASVSGLRVGLWQSDEVLPRGAVGLTYDQLDQIPELLLEMCENHDHYRETAEAFSTNWYQGHDPVQTVTQLISSAQSARAWAA